MEQLIEIIHDRLRLLANEKLDTLPQQRLAELLIQERKKEHLREISEQRLMRSVATTHIKSPYEIEKFQNESLSLMKLRDPNFTFQPNLTNSPIDNIVEMYSRFFTEQKSMQRAAQVKVLWRKKLCEEAMLLPTLFSWLAEWCKKQFNSFLRRRINAMNANSQAQMASSEPQVAKSLLNPEASTLSLKMATLGSRKNLSPPPAELRSQIVVNREIILGALLDEAQNYYKMVESCIPDLDLGYIRKIKKNFRKDEFIIRLDEVARSLIRAHPEKKQLDSYLREYQAKFPEKIQQTLPSIILPELKHLNYSSPLRRSPIKPQHIRSSADHRSELRDDREVFCPVSNIPLLNLKDKSRLPAISEIKHHSRLGTHSPSSQLPNDCFPQGSVGRYKPQHIISRPEESSQTAQREKEYYSVEGSKEALERLRYVAKRRKKNLSFQVPSYANNVYLNWASTNQPLSMAVDTSGNGIFALPHLNTYF